MAIVATKDGRNNVSGSKITAYLSLAFTGTYSAGGEPLDAGAAAGIGQVDEVKILSNGQMLGYVYEYDYTNKIVTVFGTSTQASGAEVLEGAAATAGGKLLIEVANGTNLQGITALKVQVTGGR